MKKYIKPCIELYKVQVGTHILEGSPDPGFDPNGTTNGSEARDANDMLDVFNDNDILM